jgi:hypothetical protein
MAENGLDRVRQKAKTGIDGFGSDLAGTGSQRDGIVAKKGAAKPFKTRGERGLAAAALPHEK